MFKRVLNLMESGVDCEDAISEVLAEEGLLGHVDYEKTYEELEDKLFMLRCDPAVPSDAEAWFEQQQELEEVWNS